MNTLFYTSCMTRIILLRMPTLFHVSEIFFCECCFFFLTVVPSPVHSTVALSSSVVQETDKPPVTGMVKLSKVDLICITTSTQ